MGLREVERRRRRRQGLTQEVFDHEVTVSEHSPLRW